MSDVRARVVFACASPSLGRSGHMFLCISDPRGSPRCAVVSLPPCLNDADCLGLGSPGHQTA